MSVSNGLFILHDLHLKLKSVQDELDRGPRLIKAKENLLAKRQAELDNIKAQHTERRKLADAKNLQLKSNETKLADLRMKLNMSSSNREFDIRKATEQIAAAEAGQRERAQKLRAAVAEAETVLPGEIAPTYRRLVNAFGA